MLSMFNFRHNFNDLMLVVVLVAVLIVVHIMPGSGGLAVRFRRVLICQIASVLRHKINFIPTVYMQILFLFQNTLLHVARCLRQRLLFFVL